MPQLEKVASYKRPDGSAEACIYKIGEVNHLVTLTWVNVFGMAVRNKEVLCLGIDHAKKIFDDCVDELKREEIIQ